MTYVLIEITEGEPATPLLFSRHESADSHFVDLLPTRFSCSMSR